MIVRTGGPNDIPALQAIDKKARTVYAALAGFEFAAAFRSLLLEEYVAALPRGQADQAAPTARNSRSREGYSDGGIRQITVQFTQFVGRSADMVTVTQFIALT